MRTTTKNAIQEENLSKSQQEHLSESNDSIERRGVYCDELMEAIPEYVKAGCEKVYAGKNNNYIVMGRDRPGDRTTGYGGSGDHQASMIDIVVGRSSYFPKKDTYVDPNFATDSARIYISQKTDLDKNFGCNTEGVSESIAKSGIGIKADSIRMIGREEIRLITRTDKKNSQGGDLEATIDGIHLIAGNDTKDLQPMVKGDNVIEAFNKLAHLVQKLNGVVEGILQSQHKINAELKDHWHISTKPGYPTEKSPTLQLTVPFYNLRLMQKSKPSLRLNRSNLNSWTENYLKETGDFYILSRYNKVN